MFKVDTKLILWWPWISNRKQGIDNEDDDNNELQLVTTTTSFSPAPPPLSTSRSLLLFSSSHLKPTTRLLLHGRSTLSCSAASNNGHPPSDDSVPKQVPFCLRSKMKSVLELCLAVVVENSKPGKKRKDKTFINSITRSRQAWNRVASQIGGTTIRVAKETDSKMAINSDQQKKNLRTFSWLRFHHPCVAERVTMAAAHKCVSVGFLLLEHRASHLSYTQEKTNRTSASNIS
ncbi:hypothetical protein Rs2_22770 [Raphanus sativus]|nr:hypothetical protein Rs2_22770 [Raphanus sativus]